MNKTEAFTGRNSVKLFLGLFASVVAMFALVYFVQNPLFEKKSEAASYAFPVTVTLNLQKNASGKCNSAIVNYSLIVTYFDKKTGKSFYTVNRPVGVFTSSGKKESFKAGGPSAAAIVHAQVISWKLNGSTYRTSAKAVKQIVANNTSNLNIMIDCR